MCGRDERYLQALLGKPEGKISLGRPRHKWENSIKIDIQEAGCGGMDWIDLTEDRERLRAIVYAVMNLGVP
jgi:hypothetical protein